VKSTDAIYQFFPGLANAKARFPHDFSAILCLFSLLETNNDFGSMGRLSYPSLFVGDPYSAAGEFKFNEAVCPFALISNDGLKNARWLF
jgi:hypothetical protein